MNTYWLALKTEIIKGKKTFALWQAFLFPLFTALLVSVSLLGININDPRPWVRFIHNYTNTTAFFFPFFLVIIIGYYSNIENKSNTWKHLLTQPIPKLSIFLGKLSMIVILVFLSYFFLVLLGYLSALFLQFAKPVKFQLGEDFFSFCSLSGLMLKVYLSGFIIIAIQYWLSLRFRNLIVPFIIGIGLIILPIAIMIILGMAGILDQPKSLENVFTYNPYSYPFAHIFNFMKGPDTDLNVLPKASLIYLGLSIVVSFLAFSDFRKRNF
ncbi:MAG: ABC transporter permease [Bacteroidales bacterium]